MYAHLLEFYLNHDSINAVYYYKMTIKINVFKEENLILKYANYWNKNLIATWTQL